MPQEQPYEGSGYGAAVLAIVVLVVWAYVALESKGCIPHREDTTITAQASWFVGETKECVSYPLDAQTAAAAGGKGAGYAVDSLACDNGPGRNVSVRFFGRMKQPEYDAVTWKCTREQEGFTCYELSGHKPDRKP